MKKDFPNLFDDEPKKKFDGFENWYVPVERNMDMVSFEREIIQRISKAITRDTYVLMVIFFYD